MADGSITPLMVNAVTLGAMCEGIGGVRIRQLVAEGVIPRTANGKGQYDALVCVPAYYRWKYRQEKLEKKKTNPDYIDPEYERARKDREMADRVALQNALTRGDLLPIADVHNAVTTALSRFKARIRSIPSKIAPMMLQCRTATEAEDHITSGIDDALTELSEAEIIDQAGHASRDIATDDRGDAEVVRGSEAAPEVVRKRVGRPPKASQPGGFRRTGEVEHAAR